jgi:hypothetical protein
METNPLMNWIPYRLSREESNCDWLYLGDNRFLQPFFEETISRCKSLPENSSRFRPSGSFEFIGEAARDVQPVPPAAFIFHVSRCGSTLVSQLLSLDESNIVLSETPLFDQFLRKGRPGFHQDSYLSLLNDSIRLYSVPRTEKEKRVFIKTDSWHVHFYKELRKLFPATPFILLYRQPLEVLRSQQKRRGMQSVQGVIEPEIFGFNKNEIMELSMDQYMAKVLESYFTAFLQIGKSDPNSFLVNYNEGVLPLIEKIAAISGYEIPVHVKENMKERASYHGKYPDEKFAGDSQGTETLAEPGILLALYDEIETLRLSSEK